MINPLSPNIHGRILQTGLSVGIIYTEVTGVGAYSEPSADTQVDLKLIQDGQP